MGRADRTINPKNLNMKNGITEKIVLENNTIIYKMLGTFGQRKANGNRSLF